MLLTENSYNEHENKICGNMNEWNIGVIKLPKLVLNRIDRQLQTNERQALQELKNLNLKQKIGIFLLRKLNSNT